MPVTISASQTLTLLTDVDGDGQFDPGDTFGFRIDITNSGDTDATGLQFDVDLTGATFVNGSINVSPVVIDNSYAAVGNATFTANAATGVLANDVEFFSDTHTVNSFTATTSQGGSVTINSDGSFTYNPPVGFNGNDTFTYSTIDSQGLTSSTATVTMQVGPSVWFIDDSAPAGGNGTQASPFNSLAAFNAANAASGPGQPNPGDVIYLKAGTYTEADGINLTDNQILIGEGQDLVVQPTAGGPPLTLDTGSAGETPVIIVTGAGNEAITLASGNTVRGLDIGMNNAGATGIEDNGGTVGNLTISDVSFSGTTHTGAAIDIDNGGALNVTIDSLNSTGSSGIAVDLSGVSGTFNATAGTVTGGSGGAAFNVTGGTLGGTIAASISQANNADTVSISGGHGTGTLAFSGNITGTGGNGLQFSNADGTYNFTGTNSLNGGAAGIDIVAGSDATNGSTGTFSFGAGTTINHNASGDAFTLTGSDANVTVAGTITDNNGKVVVINDHDGGTITFSNTVTSSGAAAQGIEILNSNGGTVNFNGATQLSTTTNDAVDLDTANTGGTVNFNSTGNGLDITTTTGTGFKATGGGTVSVTGSGNTISAGNGTALNISNTTIGASDVTFQAISSNGGSATGIILDTTGSLGGLHVTGTGTAGTGGTIANKTGADGATTTGNGIYLNSTTDVRLGGLQLNDFQNSAIRGSAVNGFSLEDSVISGAVGNSSGAIEGAIAFGDVLATGTAGLTGTSLIDNVNISGSIEHHVEVYNQTGTMSLTISNSNIHDNTVASGSDGIQMEFRGTAQGSINIENNQFSNNKSQAIQIATLEDADFDVTISSNTVTKGTQGNEGIVLSNGGNSDLTVLIGGPTAADGNTISGFGGVAIFVGQVPGQGSASSLLQATIQHNTVTSPADATNHAVLAFVSSLSGQISQTRLLIDANTVTYGSAAARAILVDAPDAGRTPEFHATVTNNLVTATDVNAVTMISVAARNGAIGHSDVRGNDVNYTTAVGVTGINVREASGGSNVLASGTSGSSDSSVVLAANNPLSTTTVIPTAGDIPVVANSTILLPATPTLPTLPLLAAPGTPPPVVDPDPGVPPVIDPGPNPPVVDPNPPTSPVVNDGVLSQAELDFIADAARARWAASGLTDAQRLALDTVTVSVEDLPGFEIGRFEPGHITLDVDAFGAGWFVDATPGDDSEYAAGNPDRPLGDMDLLTTILHEMGHVLGLGDHYNAANAADIMYGYLHLGERRLPASGQAEGATPGSIGGEAFLGSPVVVGTLPRGDTVTITFRATIDAQINQLIQNLSFLGTISGGNFSSVFTNGGVPSILAPDTLTIGNRVYADADGSGTFNAGDSGVSGVALSLYVDANDDNIADGAAIATTTTNGSGLYSFAGLAPGNYIVGVNESNFLAGGALAAFATSGSGAADPDSDATDGDDNGQARSVGNGVRSLSVTLAYNTEPTGETDNPTAGTGDADTNDTVDFGFVNLQPIIGNLGGDALTVTEGDGATVLDQGPAAVTVSDDGANFNGGNLGVIFVSGDDASEDELSILAGNGITIAAGTVSYNGNAIGTVSGGGAGGGSLTVTFNTTFATATAVQALVGQIAYRNSDTVDPSTAQRTVGFSVTDNGGFTSATRFVTVDVTAVNDAPTLIATGGAPTFTEDGAAADLFSGVTASTAEAGQVVNQLVLTVSGLTDGVDEVLVIDGSDVTLTDGTSVTTAGSSIGVSVSVTAGVATVTLTPDGAGLLPAAIDTLVDGLAYRNDSDAPGTANRVVTLTSIRDSGGTANSGVDTATLSIAATVGITATNDAPTLAPAGVITLAGTDEDAPSLGTMVSNILTSGNLADPDGPSSGMAITTSSGNGTWEYSTDGVTWNGVGSVSDGAALLLSATTQLRYVPDAVDGETATLVFRAWDGTTGTASTNTVRNTADASANGSATAFSSATANAELIVTAFNDAPEISDGGIEAYTEGGAAVAAGPGLNLNDVDSPNLTGAMVAITDLVAGDVLAVGLATTGNQIDGTNIQFSYAAGVLTLTGSDTVANYAAVLQAVTYASTSDNPTVGGTAATRNLEWQLDDGGAANNLSLVETSQITITAVNDAPTASDNTVAVDEDGTYVFLTSDFGFGDVDGNALAFVIIDTLPLAGTLFNTVTSTAVLAGDSISAADIASGALEFTPAGDANGAAYASFTFHLQDDGGTAGGGDDTSATQTITIDVDAVNDAPVGGFSQANYAATEQTALDLKGIGPAVSDVDGGVHTVTLSVDYGILTVTAGTSGVTSITGSGTDTVIIEGTDAQLAALFNSDATSTLTYLADTDAPPAFATITLLVDDNGLTGSGGNQTHTSTAQIDITPVDDNPVANGDAVIAQENAVLNGSVFAANPTNPDEDPDGAFPFTVSAVNGQAGDVGSQITLASGALLTLNADGTFSYDANGVFDDLASFTGSGAANTTATDSFTYTLTGGSTATVTVTIQGVDSHDIVRGTAGDDTLTAGVGNDTINGAAGADDMRGNSGDDVYFVDDAGDLTREGLNQGRDTVYSAISRTLGANLEILHLEGSGNLEGTGNELGNVLFGNDGANKLNGKDGDDTMAGGNGADTLNGGTGVDRMRGNVGDDVYYMDHIDDKAYEEFNEGIDTVYSSVTERLGVNVEILRLLGSLNLQGFGNDLDNALYGNSGANELGGLAGADTLNGGDGNDSLDGGAGIDLMRGGNGDDRYIVDVSGDQTVETAAGPAGGIDSVHSAVSRTLGANLENLHLTGTTDLSGNGNELDNLITGTSGANKLQGFAGLDRLEGGDGADTLDGGSGIDEMRGGAGDDTYYADETADKAIETTAGVGGGTDTVFSSADKTLSDNLEILRLTGTGNLSGTGNNLANQIFGTSGANVLQGLGGDDTLTGGDGPDTLNGGAGKDVLIGGKGNDLMLGGTEADTFRFAATATSNDTINGFETGLDRFDLTGGSFSALLETGGNTRLTHAGGTITITGITGLTLTQWNALVLPSGGIASAGAAAAPDGDLTFAFDLADLLANPPVNLSFLADADFMFG